MTTEGDAPAEEGAPPEVAASEPVEEATEETAEETVVEETTEETAEETVVEEPETTDPTNPEAPPEPEAEASTSKPAMMMMDEAEIARKLESGDKDDRVAARRARIAARLKAKR